MGNKTFKYIFITAILMGFLLVVLASTLFLYEKRGKINYKITEIKDQGSLEYTASSKDKYWAKEILNGGYILHFRHAERDKWIDVQMYDALESDLHENGIDDSRYAENDYFDQAVCLNARGKIQAKAMGEHISHIGLPISKVVTSVSCRARQTADLTFGGFDSQHRLLVHAGPYNEDINNRNNILREFYKSLPISSDGNVIVSAHNGVVTEEMFENSVSKSGLSASIDEHGLGKALEEGGFFVISHRDGKLYLEHVFDHFLNFMMVFYER